MHRAERAQLQRTARIVWRVYNVSWQKSCDIYMEPLTGRPEYALLAAALTLYVVTAISLNSCHWQLRNVAANSEIESYL